MATVSYLSEKQVLNCLQWLAKKEIILTVQELMATEAEYRLGQIPFSAINKYATTPQLTPRMMVNLLERTKVQRALATLQSRFSGYSIEFGYYSLFSIEMKSVVDLALTMSQTQTSDDMWDLPCMGGLILTLKANTLAH